MSQQVERPEFTQAVLEGIAAMCQAANEAYPVRTFVISASDLLPVAEFVLACQKAAQAAQEEPKGSQ